ncbi:MAG: TlpA family protein disulfide reductase [Rubrivivax sp.]|nr:MAG: TlpA family protein disulfide reductase [Rubrivivax sp.]
MKDEQRRRALLALAGLMTLAPAQAASDDPSAPERVATDAPLGQTLDGKPVRLADFAGQPVIAFFWASWCPYCRNEMPVLENLQAKLGDRLRVVAINVEERAVFRKVQRALADTSRLFHTYDPGEVSAKALAKPSSVPYTLLLRGDGSVAASQKGWGENSVAFIVKHVNAVLAEAKQIKG